MIAGVRVHIEVGGAVVQRCPRLVITSRRHAPVTCAAIHIPDADGAVARWMPAGAPVAVEYGYRGGETATWVGTVRTVRRVNRDQHCLLADGPDLPLTTIRIRECYADESSAAIARHLLGHAGLPVAAIDIPDEIIPRFPVSTIPVWQAARQLLHTLWRSFGHDMAATALWLGRDGLNLGDFDEPGDTPVIAAGENLIRHRPSGQPHALGEIETYLLPGLAHSRLVRLVDDRLGVDAASRALEVRHVIEREKARTFVGYGVEHVWY